ncbi:GEVED domain-containing protein [Flavobacterium sp. UBA4197]|uniref:GEVED domain-containing protein n=1 Tax=Flavobacterium sp. UBA4197 TaxID=1946546 RepID=UPI00257E8B14|nr:GEVED domain-containing protein [Flavobacterium sp. UBA4197]
MNTTLRAIFFLTFSLLGQNSILQAQTITIGNETSNNITNDAPLNAVYEKSASESIYLSSEINTSGTITALSWQHSSTFNAAATNNLKVYLKLSSLNSLPTGAVGTTDFAGYTEVYSGSLPAIATAGWNTITLNTPFAYNKSAGNLSVLVVRDAATKDDNNYPRFRATTTNPNYLSRKYSNGVNFFNPTAQPWTSTTSMDRFFYRPNLRLTMATTVSYCPIGNNNSCLYGGTVTNVTFAGINNTTECSQDNYSYIDYTQAVNGAQVTKGTAYTLSVTVDNPGNSGGVGAWIDFNKNGIFESSEFFSLGTQNSSNSTVFSSAAIQIPATAQTGTTRMRIRSKRLTGVTAAESCEFIGSARGEVEDYTVNIAEQPMGVSDFDKTAVKIYPNPTANVVTIASSETIKTISVYTPLGQQIISGKENQIDLSAYTQGIYPVKIEFENGQIQFKKIIKK